MLLQALFFALLYIITIDVFKMYKKWLLFIILFGSSVLYGGRLVRNFFSVQSHKSHLKEIIFSYYVDYKKIKTFGPSPIIIKNSLDCAMQNGVYYPPTINQLYPEIYVLNMPLPQSSENNMNCNIDIFNDYPQASRITGWAYLEHNNQTDQQIGLVLKSNVKSFVFSTESNETIGLKTYFTNAFQAPHKQNGFKIRLDKQVFGIPSGSYQIGVCILQKGKIVGIRFTPQQIDI
jgi:hypothetical protein